MSDGLAEAIHSEQTPPFEQVVGTSFERGDARQRARMLRPLLDAAGPAAATPLLRHHAPEQDPPVPVESRLAPCLHPDAVERLARHAAQVDPTIVGRMSRLYANDPELGRTLGGATLSIALGKLAETR